MAFFILFVFGTIVFGAGVMLAPAWPTAQPRIALSAALSLGLVMGGAIFWAMTFGWHILVMDYLLFALVSAIFVGGTLSYGQRRAEQRGEVLLDEDQGWPGAKDLLFFGVVVILFALPALVLPVPLDTDAQGFGYLGLMVKLGGGFSSLAPFHPDVSYLYAPGFPMLVAYFSNQLGIGLQTAQIGIAGILGVLVVALAYDFGAEIRDKRLGRAMALCMLIGTGLLTAYMDSHFTTLLGLVFALAFLIFAYRYLHYHLTADAVAAGLMLGATVLAHPDTTIILGLGFAAWLVTMPFMQPRPTVRVWLTMAFGMPLVALLGLAPWLWTMRDLFGSSVQSPFTVDMAHLGVMVLYHGGVVVLLAGGGAWVALRKRESAAGMAVLWLLLLVEFAALGILGRLIPALENTLLRYDYPFSLAWHGPIIPYSILGGFGLLYLWERWGEAKLSAWWAKRGQWVMVGLLIVAFSAFWWWPSVLNASKGRIGFFGAFASKADVTAMEWIKRHTPLDARILNYPGTELANGYEGDWAAVISERDTTTFRWQPFFIFTGDSLKAVEDAHAGAVAFWQNPADPAHLEFIRAQHISYVLVPQFIGQPDSFAEMFRWRTPSALPAQSQVADAPYLQLVFDQDGAQVYEVKDAS